MAVLAGIDEAGYGPILGPLVVSCCTFSVPRRLIKADLWQVLRKSVGNKRKHLAGRLLVADSKKAYSKSTGIKPLERTVLACLKCLYKEPDTLSEFLMMVCPDLPERLSDYPWYKEADNYGISADRADLEIASSVLNGDMGANGIELVTIRSCCLDVAYYNRMVSSVKNKANVLFSATSGLIKKAYDNFGGDELQVVVDRQGGRIRYRRELQRMFPDMELRILRESAGASSYELKSGGKKVRLHFAAGADDRFLPVSLASMVSKYLRELLVDNINRYFARFHAGLRPTAGYWKDGLRFIRDLKTNVPHVRYDPNQLVRCR
ncbi:MAG: ribonuclease H family protein [Planctomycetota bacterium]|jgi:ribonuclease HII